MLFFLGGGGGAGGGGGRGGTDGLEELSEEEGRPCAEEKPGSDFSSRRR